LIDNILVYNLATEMSCGLSCRNSLLFSIYICVSQLYSVSLPYILKADKKDFSLNTKQFPPDSTRARPSPDSAGTFASPGIARAVIG